MADPQQAADAPRKAAKGLAGVFKGKPAWVWVAGITVLLGVAYLTFSRRNTEDPGTGGTDNAGTDDGYYDYGTPTYTTNGSEGAYGGWDRPPDTTPVIDDKTNPQPGPNGPIVVNVNYPAPTGGGKHAATGTPVHQPVKGGAKTWEGHRLSWWQNPRNQQVHRKVKVRGHRNKVYRWKWPGGGGFIHTRPFAGHAPADTH